MGNYKTIEDATIARVNRVNQVFGQYKNSCEGINHGAKPMKKRKPKKIVKLDVQQIYDDIVKLKKYLQKWLIEFTKSITNWIEM